MKILSLDTSATSGSVCLFDSENKKVSAEYYINTKLTHSQTLMPMLISVLSSTDTDISDIDLFAVNVGPGSFTGIRIGVSAVKGMAMPSDKPCVGVSTLEAMAYNYIDTEDVILCSCMDARRNQVYNALFTVIDGEVSRLCDDRALSVSELLSELSSFDKKIVLIGDGAELVFNSVEENNTDFHLAPPNRRYQTASSTAMCAEVKYNNGDILSSASLMPTYLRPSQAERERKNRESKE